MKRLLTYLLLFCPLYLAAQPEIQFDKYFEDQTLRMDYYHTGDAHEEFFALDRLYRQGVWAGNPDHCIQPFELGTYKLVVMDTLSHKVIFTRGYSTIFGEYQTIGPANNGIKATYHETILIPFPKAPVKVIIQKRAKDNSLADVFTILVDPSDYHINTEKYQRSQDEVIPFMDHGDPHHHVDLVILGEGYTLAEKEKFKNDLKYYANLLMNFEPYKSRTNLFNINGVFAPSEESGTDEPRQHSYKNTRFGSSFNTFDTDRYLTVDDNKSIHDAIASVPYDAVLIMVNKDRYGGGGIYNFQTVFATGSAKKDYVFLHEFGHAFAGLADEYYTSQVAYQDIFTPGVEPLEANITALTDPAHVKWKDQLSPGLQVPTPWGKEIFDGINQEIDSLRDMKGQIMDKLDKNSGNRDELNKQVKVLDERIFSLVKKADDFIFNHPLKDKVGVFEGANYLSKGYYRPTINSMMQRFGPDMHSYGPINDQAIIKIIEFYTIK